MSDSVLSSERRFRPSGCRCCGWLLLLPLLFALALWWEARPVHLTHPVIEIPGLPEEFNGFRIAFLADIHRGPFMSEQRVGDVVMSVNKARPDVIGLGGDYVHRSKRYIPSVWRELGALRAHSGVYAVLGNHDYWESEELTVNAMTHAGVVNLTNRNVPLERGGKRIFIAGVDDVWAGKPDLTAALKGVPEGGVAIVLCHNPDYIEEQTDLRAKLWLSGHTHGGQVCLPGGRPIIHPSKCGLRYIAGHTTCEGMQIYVSRGVGTVTPPWRLNCPAEVPVIELRSIPRFAAP